MLWDGCPTLFVMPREGVEAGVQDSRVSWVLALIRPDKTRWLMAFPTWLARFGSSSLQP
jgi:hypothetical protein